jgi:hypothetical protein
MFCPGCGSEERQASQFCRGCGTDLRVVRVGFEHPDSITASAVSAREEIGRAVAEKIREMEDPRYMRRFTQYVLPKIDKFLESHEEKRLRRLRSGVITALIGLAVGIPAGLLLRLLPYAPKAEVVIFLGYILVFSAVAFATGLGLLINGLLFSRPRKGVEDPSSQARVQNLLDEEYAPPSTRSSGQPTPSFRSQTTSNLSPTPGSVTEQTTHHLKHER